MFKQKEFSTGQKSIGSLIQIILSMCMWTPFGHVAKKHSCGQKLSTQEFKTQMTQVQVLQKSITNNCHMLMLRNYQILYWLPINRRSMYEGGIQSLKVSKLLPCFLCKIPMSYVTTLFNLKISVSLLYIVSYSIPHLPVILYVLLVAYILNQLP